MDLFDIDPEHLRRSNDGDGEWWDRLIANSPLWSSDGSSARDPFPIIGLESQQRASRAEGDTDTDHDTDSSSGGAPGAGQGKGRSSWVVVGSVREVAQELALVPLPDDVDVCLAEAEELLFARDRITCALADRVGRVHRAGQAKQHGHASTRSWLRTAAGMTVGGAGRLLMLGAELPRLPQVREKFAAGELAAGVVEAICAAVAGLTDEQAGLAEPILVELAGKAGAAEVAKAGRHLRAVLDPDGEERDEQADYGRRFLRVRPGKGGGVEGEFYIPREPGARLMTLLQEYAKKKAEGDDRTLTERQADALIAALEQQIVTELLVVVSAESLPTDPENTDPTDTDPATEDPADHPGDPASYEAEADAGAESAGDTGDPATGEADPATDPTPAAGSGNAATGLRDEESRGCGVGEREAGKRRPGECAPDDTASTSSAEGDESGPTVGGDGDRVAAPSGAPHGTRRASARPADAGGRSRTAPSDTAPSDTAPSDTGSWGATASDATASDTASSGAPLSQVAPSDAASSDAALSEAGRPDPPPEDASPHHTHAGPRPAGECRHGQGACRCGGEARCSHAAQAPGTAQGASATAPGGPGPEPETPPGRASRTAPRAGRGTRGAAQGASPGAAQGVAQGASPEATPGASAGTPPGAFQGTALGASLGPALGASLGMVPGLLLATGQVLPLSSVHRLARTSTLVRIVMNADGQILDMGRKVRLATPAQRRAIFARYATCWIDGCPLPATMCQIDHADNWSTGGLTDLKLLGPACQFHNRDRYQHPERYTRRKAGTDRWAFTYHRLGTARRLRE
ncbi:HNH endonuclease signature motif containing protein [Microbispora hainanensis]|uniref:DUF222 domain-containing protein n=1 Tax=Microbispora hainanensis TaxID=568844 RepID=A0A544YAS1_9ACTN|nr:HNH endonuclease signature motif containing protein [Microbispora hainanensis]TQS13889.1 DUF222 domain-containing protein [Microbispora hainanensis]